MYKETPYLYICANVKIINMKFTQEEAFEKLKGILTNNGKKPLRMSEKSIRKQLETLIPLVADEEMELDDFVTKVKDTFSTMNSNAEKDNADFIKEWEKNHQPTTPTNDNDKNEPDEATAALLKRIEDLEKKNAEREKEAVLAQKRRELLKAMKEKGIKDEQWAKDFIAEVSITEDLDIEKKADAYLKIYNKSQADMGEGAAPFGSSSTSGVNQKQNPFASVKKMLEQRNKELDGGTSV